MTEPNKPATIKYLCDKYGLSHRQLGILIGYSKDHVQRVNTGKRRATLSFETSLQNVASCLKNGDAKIPE